VIPRWPRAVSGESMAGAKARLLRRHGAKKSTTTIEMPRLSSRKP
jgi:hypothetical protein